MIVIATAKKAAAGTEVHRLRKAAVKFPVTRAMGSCVLSLLVLRDTAGVSHNNVTKFVISLVQRFISKASGIRHRAPGKDKVKVWSCLAPDT